MSQDNALSPRRFLRKAQAKALLFGNPSDSTWYYWVSQGLISAPVKTGPSRFSPALWAEDELIAAQERLIAERDARIAERERRRASDGGIDADPQRMPEVPSVKTGPPLSTPRPPSRNSKSERNARIGALYRAGKSVREIAREYDLSGERIRQILTKIGAGRPPGAREAAELWRQIIGAA
jgi:hypothetical protein